MVSSGTVQGDLSSIKTALSNYSSATEGLSSSWKGTSFDSFSSKSQELISDCTSVLEKEMSAFANACSLYDDYINAKSNLQKAEYNYNLAVSQDSNNHTIISQYQTDMNNYKTQVQQLKSQIETALSEASSGTITVPATNTSISATSSFNMTSVSPSSSAIEAHSQVSQDERSRRIDMIGGADSGNIVDIEVPYWDGEKEQTMKLTVNKNLTENYQNVFRELTDMKYPIKPNNTDAYEYRSTVSGSRLSDHAYGGTIDINYDDNPMVDSGPNPEDDGNNPYVVNEDVVKAFAKQGFYWGGDWNSAKDYMHFSWTGW